MTLTLNHWGLARALVENGELVAMEPAGGDPAHSPISDNFVGILHGPMRIGQPMVRHGWLAGDGGAGRGADSFVPLDWDRAADLVAGKMRHIISEHGNEAIFGGSYGWSSAGRFHHAQSQLHRFLNLAGGYVRSVNTHSHAAAEVTLPHIIGSTDGLIARHTPWELIVGHTDLFVAFGGLALKNAQVSSGGVSQHRIPGLLRAAHAAGTAFVNISPLRDDMEAALEADWIAPLPNSDVALMLGLAHVLETEGRADRAFLDRYTTGYPEFRAYLLGQSDGLPKDPDWAAAVTGVPAGTIRALARRMASGRTMIAMAWSLQRADHGEQVVWMTVTLAAMLGQIGLPGGGFGLGYCCANRVGNAEPPIGFPALPQRVNAVKSFIPVARLTEMLERPGDAFDYNGLSATYPDIRLIWWAGGNPFHHQQDLGRLRRAWQRPELVVVQEPFWNAIARHADIVLPCTLPMERNDIGLAKSEPHLVAMKQVLSPFADARHDHDALALVAGRLGFADDFTEGRDEMGWLRHLYEGGRKQAARAGETMPEFDSFWAAGEYRYRSTGRPAPLLAAFRADPAATPLATPSGRIEIRSARVAGFGYDECPGMPTWLPPAEWLGNAPEGALHLISNQPARKLHSQLDLGPYSRAGKIEGREPARLSPREAARRGIAAGDIICLVSARGRCLAGAVISEDVADGVVQMATGAWLDLGPDGLDRHGNVNVVTADRPTSRLAQGPSAQTALVFVERWAGPAPEPQAFVPPVIVA